MDLQLHDRVFLITGGTDGLGLALAQRLLDEGARVAICGRDGDRLAAATARLDGGERVLGLAADVTSPTDVSRLLDAITSRWARLDGVVNNAGTHASGPFAEIDDAAWSADLELKVIAAARIDRAALELLAEGDGGAILHTLNVFAKAPGAGTMPTSVARAAGMAMVKALSRELAPRGIRANAVVVGFIESGQWPRLAQQTGRPLADIYADFVARYEIPLGRVGRAEEFADTAAFLLSPRASYVTGTAVNVDGGACAVV